MKEKYKKIIKDNFELKKYNIKIKLDTQTPKIFIYENDSNKLVIHGIAKEDNEIHEILTEIPFDNLSDKSLKHHFLSVSNSINLISHYGYGWYKEHIEKRMDKNGYVWRCPCCEKKEREETLKIQNRKIKYIYFISYKELQEMIISI